MTLRQQSLSRSYLFVPGNRPDRFDKAMQSGADTVIIDLEDAVSPAEKMQARKAVIDYLTPEHGICLRVNGTESDWFNDDLELCTLPGVNSIMLPKVETMDQVNRITGRIKGDVPVLPFIETAQGFSNLGNIAAAHGVQRLVFGTLDFMLDLGLNTDGDEINAIRLQLVLASRIAGIASPVEGVTQDIRDLDRLQLDSRRARNLGFGGKLCIHPSQVELVNSCFSYSPDEIAWARRVLAAAELSNGSAVSLDGKMIDKPVIERAEIIISRSPPETG